ncbi:MAG: glycosyltransferase [Candidatus Moraniibacteriota bacterium]|nr:MAG: glycosyltransferase [Candidatus Moranbacteria bacterium]
MASGVPIISTRVGMAPDVIEDGVDGFLAPIEDVDSIVDQSRKILDNNDLRFSFIRNGLEKSRAYTTDAMVAAMHDKMYKNLSNG